MSFFDDAISTIGRGLAQTATKALSDATGYNIGGTIQFLFGDGQTEGGKNYEQLTDTIGQHYTGDQLQLLQDTLTQQGIAISNVGYELTNIRDAVKTISLEISKIQDLLNVIKQQQLFHNWQSVDTQVQVYVNAIRTGFETYTDYVNNYSTTPPGEVRQLMADFLDPNSGPRTGLNGISAFIIGSGFQKGVLQLWSEMVSTLVAGGLMDYREAVDQYMAYYKKLVFAQLTATNQLMEAYSYNKDFSAAGRAYDNYKATILSQESTCIKWLIPIINAGITGGIKGEQGSSYTYAAYDAASQLNPSFATIGNYTEYHSASTVLKAVEATLCSLYCHERNDRRIVVYMLYLGYSSMRDILKNVEITLTKADSVGKIIRPSVSQDLGKYDYPSGPFKYKPQPDPNFDSNTYGYYIQRFVFTSGNREGTIPDGAYRITDLNSSGHLVPQTTYASAYAKPGSPYGNQAVFLTDSLLGCTLLVDDTTHFDFMNFMAYNYPSPQFYGANL